MFKAIDKWLTGYLRSYFFRPLQINRPIHVIFALADHFEPLSPGGQQPFEVGKGRVDHWVKKLPPFVEPFFDFDGFHPRHTFFFPEEEYHRYFLDALKTICACNLGEVEVHLHHDKDSEDGLRKKLTRFRDLLHNAHGFLGTDFNNRPGYAFIHGNWTLCNSHPEGKMCGVNNELHILKETGCYVDMTMPSGPSPTQTRTVNSIYYADDIFGKPRSHDYGSPVKVVYDGHHAKQERKDNVGKKSDALMLIQGPLALNWHWRKWGILPRLEHADICATSPPTPLRVDLWIRQHIHVKGRPEWIFVKVHTHGCLEGNMKVLLGDPLKEMYSYLSSRYNDGVNFCLHYVTAREMYNIVKAAEAGAEGNPGEFRDFEIKPPAI